MTWIPCLIVLAVFVAWLLFYTHPREIMKLGCWLAAWGEARVRMQRIHRRRYTELIAERTPVPEGIGNPFMVDRIELSDILGPMFKKASSWILHRR